MWGKSYLPLQNAVRPVIRPYFDPRIRSVISPIFPYNFRRSQRVPENGRVEQSGTDFEVAAESARFGRALNQPFLKHRLPQRLRRFPLKTRPLRVTFRDAVSFTEVTCSSPHLSSALTASSCYDVGCSPVPGKTLTAPKQIDELPNIRDLSARRGR